MTIRFQGCYINWTVGFLMLSALASNAQDKYLDKKGVIVFEASERSFEEVKAKNESATAILDITTNEIASLALIRGFRFKNALMQEHFNENYIESDLYPKAVFRGRIVGFDRDETGTAGKEYTLKGVLEIREQKKNIEPVVQIQIVNNVISLRGNFEVLPQDFGIQIPKIVENKIAKVVVVRFNFKLVANEDK